MELARPIVLNPRTINGALVPFEVKHMFIRKPTDLGYSDVTPKSVYTRRREFLQAMGITGAAAFAGAAAWRLGMPLDQVHATSKLDVASKSPFSTTEKETPYNDVTHYNNFYEF